MSDRATIFLKVDGMTCDGCARSVERIVKKADPAATVSVDLAKGEVSATTSAPAADLAAMITAAGYEAAVQG